MHAPQLGLNLAQVGGRRRKEERPGCSARGDREGEMMCGVREKNSRDGVKNTRDSVCGVEKYPR